MAGDVRVGSAYNAAANLIAEGWYNQTKK